MITLKEAILAQPTNLNFFRPLLIAQLGCGKRNEAEQTFEGLAEKLTKEAFSQLTTWFGSCKSNFANFLILKNFKLPPELDEKTVPHYEDVARSNPTIAICKALVTFFRQRNAFSKAHWYSRRCGDLDPGNSLLYMRDNIELMTKAKNYSLAIKYAEEIIRHPEVIGKDHCVLGYLYHLTQKNELAVQYFGSGFALDSTQKDFFGAYDILSEWKITMNHENAIIRLKASIPSSEYTVCYHSALSQVYYEKGDYL